MGWNGEALVERGICSPRMKHAGKQENQPHVLDPARVGDHLDRLHRAAWALCGTRHDADDLVQETYARVLARRRMVRPEGDIAYLLRALHNTFLSQKRSERRRPAPGELDEASERLATSRPVSTEEAAEQRLVYGAIANLPDDFRAALVLVDVAGLSYAEAARALRIREGTLTSRVFRARREAAKALHQS
jgi:RNA polymerase sigma-70 factor (ECF subfamily)